MLMPGCRRITQESVRTLSTRTTFTTRKTMPNSMQLTAMASLQLEAGTSKTIPRDIALPGRRRKNCRVKRITRTRW